VASSLRLGRHTGAGTTYIRSVFVGWGAGVEAVVGVTALDTPPGFAFGSSTVPNVREVGLDRAGAAPARTRAACVDMGSGDA